MAPRMKAMTAVDAAWYNMDGPVNLAQITGVLLTRKPLNFKKVRDTYRQRLLKFDRFRQRVVEPSLPVMIPCWEDDPRFDIDQHVHHVALPEPSDRAALLEFLSDVVSTPLDRSRPLWEVHVVDRVAGGSALIMRFHHCIGDGTAMMAVSLELFDAQRNARRDPARPPTVPMQAGMFDHLIRSADGVVTWSMQTAGSAIDTGLDLVLHPERTIEKAAFSVGGAGVLAAELLRSPDPQGPFKGEFGMRKRIAWSDPLALDDIKTIGRLCDSKVNDVLVAGMTGAIRHYLSGRGIDVDRITQRAFVPVDLRPRERALELGNEFGLVILDLPVHISDPLVRLRKVTRNMDALKRSPEAGAVLSLFSIIGYLPKPLEDFAVDLFGSKASLVMTNVAGPRQRLYLAGVPIDEMIFWVPHPGRELGVGVSILSYNGAVSLAVVADARLVPDPEAITQQFSREFAAMLELSRQSAGEPAGRPRRKKVKTASE